jgi:hypothetical protein
LRINHVSDEFAHAQKLWVGATPEIFVGEVFED